MKFQLVILSALFMLSASLALPVPDEEVSVVQSAPVPEVKPDVVPKPEEKPVEVVKPESRAVAESGAASSPSLAPGSAIASAPFAPAGSMKSDSKIELTASAPDAETAQPALPAALEKDNKKEKKEDKKPEKKIRTEAEPIAEQVKSVSVVDAPAANVEVQKQIVDELKPAVHVVPAAIAKSADLAPPAFAPAAPEGKEIEPAQAAAEPTPKQSASAETALKSDIDPERLNAVTNNAAPAAETAGALKSNENRKPDELSPARQERDNEKIEPVVDEAKAVDNIQVISGPSSSVASVPAVVADALPEVKSLKPESAETIAITAETPKYTKDKSESISPELKLSSEQSQQHAADALTESNKSEKPNVAASIDTIAGVAAPISDVNSIKALKPEEAEPAAPIVLTEAAANAPEAKKIDEHIAVAEEVLGLKKSEEALAAGASAALPEPAAAASATIQTDPLKKLEEKSSSEEKSLEEKKSDESKESEESKESDESKDSKEDKSN